MKWFLLKLCLKGFHRGDTLYDFGRRRVTVDCRTCGQIAYRAWP